MDSGPVVIDISSDEEFDECRVDGSFDDILQLLDEDGGEGVNNDIVDVDQYFNSVENLGCLRPWRSLRDESDDDCMVLDGDPEKPVEVGHDKRNGGDGSDDLQIVGQKGQVACRDFPHSRHLCANFPFNTTPHEKHCKLCHCFVCDSPAPCMYWGNGVSLTDHCHATDGDDTWKARRSFKKTTLAQKSRHPFLPAVRTPQSISHPFQVPLPIQTSNGTPLHPLTTTTTSSSRYVPTERHHQNHRRLLQTLPVRKENNRSLAVPRAVSHTQFKKIGITGSGLRSSSLNRPQSTPSGPHQMHKSVLQRPQHPARALLGSQQQPLALPRSNAITGSGPRSSSLTRPQSTPSGSHQMHKSVLQRPQHPARALLGSQQQPLALPRAQSMAIASERSSCTPVSLEGDTIKRWQDILAGVAAELGVSHSISKSSTASQPYTVSSQPPAIYVPDSSNQGIEPHNDRGSITIPSNSLDFEPKWLDGAADQIFLQRSDAVCGDVSIESFFTAAEEIVSAPEKVIGHPEVDPSSFLYDFEGTWSSSTGNV